MGNFYNNVCEDLFLINMLLDGLKVCRMNSWINFIVKETESALTLLYSYMGFYEELKKEGVAENANKNPEFWRVHTAAVQHTLFIYLGRLSDDTREGKSFSDFKNYCIQNVSDFSKDSFLLRRSDALEVNPNYLDNSGFPSAVGWISLRHPPHGKYNKYLFFDPTILQTLVMED